jgi:hypothetical protein
MKQTEHRGHVGTTKRTLVEKQKEKGEKGQTKSLDSKRCPGQRGHVISFPMQKRRSRSNKTL